MVALLLASSILLLISRIETCHSFSIKEATIQQLHSAFHQNQLTSKQLVEFYLSEIKRLNPLLKGVIEVNPDAVVLAQKADEERERKKKKWDEERETNNKSASLPPLHGIPVLLKDNIATKDKLNTTAGSYALLGSAVRRDAAVVKKLRRAGAIVLGKASLCEWAHFRASSAPSGWSARGGQGKNPYSLSAAPCGSSSGSAISVVANMAAISLGTETDGSILCPSSYNAVVGIKPTVGLTSRAGVVPISPRQDTVGPMCRSVADAVHVLDAIVGFDARDAKASARASKYIPRGGYVPFLKPDGLVGKRLGIVRDLFFSFDDEVVKTTFERHLVTLRKEGAVIIDNLDSAGISKIYSDENGEWKALLAEFKIAINDYLGDLVTSQVRSLSDLIKFNDKNFELEKMKEYGQDILLDAEATNGIGKVEKEALRNLTRLSKNGLVKTMKAKKLDALVAAGPNVVRVLAIGGFPGISVPAAYNPRGVPIGIVFGGLKGSEPTLIEIAYAFEQATKIRKPPTFLP